MPDTIQDINAKVFPSGAVSFTDMLTDPFSGELLRYMATETQIKIYSVGPNEIDDDGLITAERGHPLDVGVALQQ